MGRSNLSGQAQFWKLSEIHFLTPCIFANGLHFVALNWLWATKTRSKYFYPPFIQIFWKLSTWRFDSPRPKKISRCKFSVTERFTKKRVFHIFSCPPAKKQSPVLKSLLMPLTFHIASLNRYTPKFSGVPQKWPGINSLASRSSQSEVMPIFCRWKTLFCFFWTKKVFLAKRLTFAYSMS